MGRISALFRLVVGRSVATPGLLAVRFCGVLVAVALVAAVSLYSTALGDAMLQGSLKTDQGSLNLAVSDTNQPLAPAAYAALDRYIRHGEQTDLGLPLEHLHVHHNTSTVPLYRLNHFFARATQTPLAVLALHYYEGLTGHVIMVSGSFDPPRGAAPGDAPVVISQYTARTLQLKVGDRLIYSTDGHTRLASPMVVAGIFVPKDVGGGFWDIDTGEATYRSLIMPRLDTFLSFVRHRGFNPEYFWLSRTVLGAIHLSDANMILDSLARVSNRVAASAPGATLLTRLNLDINSFLDQYALLPVILLILVAPILALVLYAVAMTTALVLDRQAGEIVLMRSRGAARTQVFGLYVVEGIVLGIAAVVIGPLLGLPLARLIGHASGFLSFNGNLPFSLRLNMQTYLLAGGTALLCLLAGLLPALSLSRRPMAAFKQEQARLRQRPLWQRLFLDVLVMAVALYGLWVLIRQGPVTSGSGTAAIAQDPVIGIAPILFAVAIMLIISRILPWLATLGLFALGRADSPPAHMALQSVARAPRQPMRLVQLCTLTLTLGVFAATVAGVEAGNRSAQQIYAAGTQVRLMEYNAVENQWAIMPLADHLALPGVYAAMPALRFMTSGNVINTTSDGTAVNVLGIDPGTAGRVIWFRPDFADVPLKALLTVVATPGPNAIVSDNFLRATGLHIGDQSDVTLSNNETVHIRIAATAHYFPTLDPHDNPFVITNLAYLRKASRSPAPSEVWLATDANQEAVDRIINIIRAWPRRIVDYEGVTPRFSALEEPLTAGIFGVVSVGFIIAVGLVLLGFFAYAYLSLQQRRPEFAIVRALGFSPGQVRWLLLCEQFFLLGAGVLGGIIAGMLTTRLFLPYMPIAVDTTPPFLVTMPWLAIGEFILAVLIVVMLVLSAHVYMLLRLQLGRVLRLGES